MLWTMGAGIIRADVFPSQSAAAGRLPARKLPDPPLARLGRLLVRLSRARRERGPGRDPGIPARDARAAQLRQSRAGGARAESPHVPLRAEVLLRGGPRARHAP